VAFRFIVAGAPPDHDTLANFRRRFLDELSGLFAQVLEVAGEMKVLKFDAVSLDGTKVKANASRHSTLSYGHIEQLESSSRRKSKACWRWRNKPTNRRHRMG
jgi:transposase